jgi:outer membrane protein assembly factor BamB
MGQGRLGGVGRGAFTGRVCGSGGNFGADASDVLGSGGSARVLILAACGGGTEALEVDPAARTFRQLWSSGAGANGSPIVAGGLVWALDWSAGELYGLRPATGAVVIKRTTDPLDHFVAPAAAEGLLVVPTAGGVEAFSALG